MFTNQASSFDQVVHNFITAFQTFWQKKPPFLIIHFGVLILGSCVVCLGFWRVATAGETEYSQPEVTADTQVSQPTLLVEVAGAVESPGVYTLPVGSRVAQALEKAGNPTSDVDKEYLTRELNLAQELTDQQKIYLPFYLENEETVVSDGEALSANAATSGISLNKATASQLMELEGIGEKRASDIIAGRPYQTVDELVTKKVITATQFEKIKDKLKI